MEIGPIFRSMKKNKFAVGLLVIEIAFTLTIALNCFNIVQDQKARMNTPTGYDDENMIAVLVKSYGPELSDRQYLDGVKSADLEALRAMPGVIDACLTSNFPLIGGGSSGRFRDSRKPVGTEVKAPRYTGDPHFLNTFGLTLAEGRDLIDSDVPALDATGSFTVNVLITKDLADALFPGESALGKQIQGGGEPDTVVGVVEYMYTPYNNGDEMETRIVIYPARPGNASGTQYLIRVEPEAFAAVLTDVDKVLGRVNAERVFDVKSLSEYKEGGYTLNRYMGGMLTIVTILLVFVTAIGILGMAYFSVTRRTRQIGVRRALGANRMDIIRYFLMENTLIVCFGLALGLVGALLLNSTYTRMVQPSTALSPGLIIGALFFLWGVGTLSTLLPAIKASRIAPAEATRV